MLKISFQVGSYNYGLNDDDSDIDLKIFEYPTFDQLYQGQYIKPKSHMGVGIDEDYEIKDIRELIKQLEKSNPSWIETLFSVNTQVTGGESRTLKVLQCFKDKIAIHNPKALFNTCFGMYIQKRKSLLKGTSGTIHLIERDGYDSKAGLHAFRCLDLLRRIYRFYNEYGTHKLPLISVYERALRYRFYLKDEYIVDMDTNIAHSLYNRLNTYPELIPSDIISIKRDSKDFLPNAPEGDNLIELVDKDYFFMRSIREGNFPYEEFLDILDEMERQVLQLKDTEFYTQEKYTRDLDYAKKILQKEILREIVKEETSLRSLNIAHLDYFVSTGDIHLDTDILNETEVFDSIDRTNFKNILEYENLSKEKKEVIDMMLEREVYSLPTSVNLSLEEELSTRD